MDAAHLVVTDSVGYFGDSLQVEVDVNPDNPWGVISLGQMPRLVSIDATIAPIHFTGFYGHAADMTNQGSFHRLNIGGQRIDAGSFADQRLKGTIAQLLSETDLAQAYTRHYSLQAQDFRSRIAVLQQFGYGFHVAAGNEFTIYPIESLWRADRRDEGPFRGIGDRPRADLSAFPATFRLPDMRIRHDYDGAGLYAVIHASTGAISARITATGEPYVPPTVGRTDAASLFPHRDVGGAWPNEDIAIVRLLGELARVRFESEVGSAQVDLDPTFSPGYVVAHGPSHYVVIGASHDITQHQTTLQLVRYLRA